MTQFVQNWTLPQVERFPASTDKAALQDAIRVLNQRLEALNRVTQEFKAEEEEFLRQERQYLEDSIRVFENASRIDINTIQQEEANVQKVQNELRLIEEERNRGPQKEELENDIARIRERIASARSTLSTLQTRRGEAVQAIKISELTGLKVKNLEDPSINTFQWVSQNINGVPRGDFVWKKFTTEVTAKDKGAGFLARLNGLNVATLSKTEADAADAIFQRKADTLATYAVKSKTNNSLDNLITYIGNVSEANALYRQIDADQIELEQREREALEVNARHGKHQSKINILQQRVEFSKNYINTLKTLLAEIQNFNKRTQERLNYQDEYSQALQSNAQGLTNFVERTSHVSPQQNINDLQSSERKEVVHQFFQESEFQSQPLEPVKEQRVVAHTENQYAGEHVTSPAERRVEAHPRTDLQNSEFAKNGRSSCETCNIF